MFLSVIMLTACHPQPDEVAFAFEDPDAAPPLRGGGGPAVSFPDGALWQRCATLDGGEHDKGYHNLVMPYRGHLVMPWAAEWGQGGLSFFDVSDPCAPVRVGDGTEHLMRETHAIGFVHLPDGDPNAGDWAVASRSNGLVFWDVSDPAYPVVAGAIELPNVFWPDAYARVVLSLFWQYPWVYVAAADNGVFVVDATDPRAPILAGQYGFEPVLRAAGVFVLGNRMLVTGSKILESALLDVSDPIAPQLMPDGLFSPVDASGVERAPYHANMVGPYGLFTRKDEGGGPIVMDLDAPGGPAFAGDFHAAEGSGGYVFWDEGFLFQGESSFGNVYDARELPDIRLVGTVHLEGDLDTLIPYGNVVVASVDDGAVDGVASIVVPWLGPPDTTPPQVLLINPPDGAAAVPTTARIGVGFSEFVEPSSVFAGSIRLWADDEPVDGWGSAQETTASYTPKELLRPGTTYTVEVLAGGVTDLNGNAVAQTVRSSFTTAGP